MSTFNEAVASFAPISLEAMDDVRLLNRMDTKYLLQASALPAILEKLVPEYSILEIGGIRVQHYQTVYFDTPQFSLYLNHHNKRKSRFKVRCRHYLDTDQCYFELKFRNNKGRTYKERCRQKEDPGLISGKALDLLGGHTHLTAGMLQPVLRVDFSRVTLVNRDLSERVTIDTGLSYVNGQDTCGYAGVAIVEIKQDRTKHSNMAGVLHACHINGTGISKYCIGIASLNHHIKQNNFKRKLHLINSLNHDLSQTNHPVFITADAGRTC